MNRRPLLNLLDTATVLVVLYSLCRVFLTTPSDRAQGIVQRIFYYHVPFAWVGFLAFFLVFVFSVLYLITRREWMDGMAVANAEVGTLFWTLVLITGPLWAKPTWGIYWTWDARLTMSFVLWVIMLAYLLLRSYIEDFHRRAVLAAVVGAFQFICVPMVYFSIRWWRTQHPSPVIMGGEGSGLAPVMRTTLFVGLGAMTLLYFAILARRYRLERLRHEAEAIWEKSGL